MIGETLKPLGRRVAVLLALPLLLSACTEDPADPSVIEGTGNVEGILFLDADDDGVFDPAAGDVPVEGVRVVAVDRETGDEVFGSPATSSATGRFSFTGLPLGTHHLVFDVSTIPDGVSVCQNPIPVSVFLDETTFAGVAGRRGCLITIAEAQAQSDGEFVIVRGVVTSSPDQQDPNWTIIEDETGGIQLFTPALSGLGIEIGDLIEVGGTVTEFNGRLELVGVELRDHIEDFGALTPEEVTIADLLGSVDARDPLQNRLFVLRGVQLATGFTSGGGRNANITDETGTLQIRVEDNISSGNEGAILTTLGIEVGKCYDLTGILGGFRGTPQLFPRAASDFVEVACN